MNSPSVRYCNTAAINNASKQVKAYVEGVESEDDESQVENEVLVDDGGHGHAKGRQQRGQRVGQEGAGVASEHHGAPPNGWHENDVDQLIPLHNAKALTSAETRRS